MSILHIIGYVVGGLVVLAVIVRIALGVLAREMSDNPRDNM